MEKILVCRICLSESVLPNAVSIGLRTVYEKITSQQFNTEDQRPQALCSMCLVRLQKANSLMLDCLEAECLFQQIINQGNTDNVLLKEKPSKLSIKSVNVINIDSSDYEKLKTGNSDRNPPNVANRITANYNDLNEQENTTEQLKRTVSDVNNENINIDTGFTKKNSSQTIKLNNINIKQEMTMELEEISTENNVYIKQEILDPEVLRIEKQIKVKQEISMLDEVQLQQENTSQSEYNAALNGSVSVDGISNWPVVSSHMVGFSSVYPGSVSNIPYIQITPLQRTQRTQKKRKSYECDICHKIFSIRGNLVKHIRIHTGERPFKCDVCAKMFLQRSHLENHKSIHTNERPFKCDFCEKAFIRNSSLRNHVAKHTGDKIYKCDTCEEAFTGRKQLTRHKLVHIGQPVRPYKCESCPRTFSHLTRLQNHILTHTSVVTKCVNCHKKIASNDIGKHKCKEVIIHQCEICQKILSDKKNLRRHVQAHYGENPFKCDICHKSFSHRGNLDRHIRTHTGERPFKCDLCPSSFTQQIHLEGHMRIHTGERPYMCEVCEKTYKDRSSLKAHERTHTGQYRHQCTVCLKRFSRSVGLHNHVRKMHSGEIVTGDVAQNVIEIEVDRLAPPAREGPVDLNSATLHIKEECS